MRNALIFSLTNPWPPLILPFLFLLLGFFLNHAPLLAGGFARPKRQSR